MRWLIVLVFAVGCASHKKAATMAPPGGGSGSGSAMGSGAPGGDGAKKACQCQPGDPLCSCTTGDPDEGGE